MSKLNIIHAQFDNEKRISAIEQCVNFFKSNHFRDFIYLVPSRRMARFINKKISLLAQKDFIIKPYIFNFSDFVMEIYNNISIEKEIISSQISLNYFIGSLQNKKKYLKYLKFDSQNQHLVGLANEVFNLVCEFEKEYITPQILKNHINSPQLEDLYFLYNDYFNWMKNNNLADENNIVWDVTENLTEQSFKKIFPRVKTIVVDGFDEFPASMKKLLEKIFDYVEKSEVIIDFEDDRERVFSHLQPTIDWLKKIGGEKRNFIADHYLNTQKDFIIKNIFSDNQIDQIDADDQCVFIDEYEDYREEVEHIAKKIKQLVLKYKSEGKYFDLGKICVTFPNPELYAPYVDEIFTEYGIPFYSTIGSRLIDSCIVKNIFLFLNLPQTNYDFDSLENLLLSRIIHGIAGDDYYNLIKFLGEYSNKYRVKEGRENWIELLNKGEISDEILKKIFSHLEPLEKSFQISELKEHIQKIVDDFSLIKNIISLSEKQSNALDLYTEFKALSKFYDMLDEVIKFAQLIGKEKYTLAEIISVLRHFASKIRFYTEPEQENSVQVLGMLECRGLDFDYLFLGGMSDGVLPKSAKTSRIVEPSIRKKLDMQIPDNQIFEDRFLFTLLLSIANKKTYVSYPASNKDKVLLPSIFIDEVKSLFKTQNWRDNYFSENNNLYSPKEFLIEVGKETNASIIINGNENINNFIHFLETEKIILSRNGFSEFNGVLNEPEIHAELSEKFNDEYSASSLEDYSNCPFVYFCKKFLNIEEAEDYEEFLSAKDKGSLYHSILYNFYAKMKESDNLPITPQNRGLAINELMSAVDNGLKKLKVSPFFINLEREKAIGLTSNNDDVLKRKGVLTKLIDSDIENNTTEIAAVPTYFEKKFGAGEIEFSLSYNDKKILLDGKIDRIDIIKESFGDTYWITDYKTGSKANLPKSKDFKNGFALQLPIYALAAKEILHNEDNADRLFLFSGADYFALKDESDGFGKKKLKSEDIEFAISIMPEVVYKIVNGISKGYFKVDPLDENKCKICAFNKVCRVDL